MANVGPSAASAKPIVVKVVFEAVRMFSPGRFLDICRAGFALFGLLVDISRDLRNKHRLPPYSSGTYACDARLQSADSVPQQISVQFPGLARGSTRFAHYFGATF